MSAGEGSSRAAIETRWFFVDQSWNKQSPPKGQNRSSSPLAEVSVDDKHMFAGKETKTINKQFQQASSRPADRQENVKKPRYTSVDSSF